MNHRITDIRIIKIVLK